MDKREKAEEEVLIERGEKIFAFGAWHSRHLWVASHACDHEYYRWYRTSQRISDLTLISSFEINCSVHIRL